MPGLLSHLELTWDDRTLTRFFHRLSSFGRVILSDKRGTGLSDRDVGMPTLEQRIDVRAALSAIRAPTLVIHRTDDHAIPVAYGRYLAEHITGARYFEQPGEHLLGLGDDEALADEVEGFLTGALPVREPDRVLATVLFTDIVGSTERAAALGDRRWRSILDDHHEIVRRDLEQHRGHEVKTMGDGFLASFDGPARGIRAACAIRDGVAPLGLEIRAGLHTGEVEVMGPDLGGIALHIGQRVSGLAQPGEVLVSSTVRDLVAGSGITFEDKGTYALKGVPDEWRVFAVAR